MALYKTAEKILHQVASCKGSVKNLVFAAKYGNHKQLFALVCETLKYSDVLEEIIQQPMISKYARGISYDLLKLLIYDHLFGKGLRCGGKNKKIIMGMQTILQSTLARIKVKRGVSRNEDLCKSCQVIPKYLRINTLLTNADDVLARLCNDGYQLSLKKSVHLMKNEFVADGHVKNLLMFNARTDFHDHPLYTSGKIIFQDKASCFPALALNPAPGAEVIDACAAPGNKTSLMAALMKNAGKIYAFDLDTRRLETMRKLLNKAGVKNCVVKGCDFLKVNPLDPVYAEVSGILVDPSCSGSGIVSRLNQLTDSTDSNENKRLKSLSDFQLLILNHALTFPAVESVVYSTCSVHEEENERVVMQAIALNPSFELTRCLPDWPRRGRPIECFETEAHKCVRCDPVHDQTNGFFVALFRKKVALDNADVCHKRKRKRKSRKKAKKRKLSDEQS